MPTNEKRGAAARTGTQDRDKSALPTASQDETDVGWGDRPEPDDEERLARERPPHWGSI